MLDYVLVSGEVGPTAASIWLGWGRREPPGATVVLLESGGSVVETIAVGTEQGPKAWRKPRDESGSGRGLVRLVRFPELTPFTLYTVEWRDSVEGDLLATDSWETLPADLPSAWPTVPTMTLPDFRGMWLPD